MEGDRVPARLLRHTTQPTKAVANSLGDIEPMGTGLSTDQEAHLALYDDI